MATLIVYSSMDSTILANFNGDGTYASGSSNSGSNSNAYWGDTSLGYGALQRSYAALWFNVSGSMPAGATISSANLTLYGYQQNGNPDSYSYLGIPNAGWNESSSYFTAMTNQIPWQYPYASHGPLTQAITGIVSNWYTGAWTNNGIAIGNSSAYVAGANNYISTREASASYYPYITITYNRAPNAPGAWTLPTSGQTYNNSIPNASHGAATDPDGDAVTYQWFYAPGPDYNSNTLVGSSSSATTRTVDTSAWANGSYKLRSRTVDAIGAASGFTDSPAFNVSHVQILSPGGIATAEEFGAQVVTPGSLPLSPGGIATAEAVGAAALAASIAISPTVGSGAAHSDNFNRADGSDLGADWNEVSGEWSIASNKLTSPHAGVSLARLLLRSTQMASADQYAQAVFTPLTNSSLRIGPVVRASLAGTFYMLYIVASGTPGAGIIRLARVSAGTYTTLATASGTISIGSSYLLRVQAVGNQIKGFLDGVEVLSATDNVIAGANTYTGIENAEATNVARYWTIDDFEADTIPGSSAAPGGIPSAEAFGAHRLDVGWRLSVDAINSAETFGNPTMVPGVMVVSPEGIATAESLGDVVVMFDQELAPSSIDTEEAVGDPFLWASVTVSPEGITTAESFGDVVIIPEGVFVVVTGIVSAEAFGYPFVSPPGDVLIQEAYSDKSLLLAPAPSMGLIDNVGYLVILKNW